MCPLSNQPINSDNVLYINSVIYNGDFVHPRNGVAELRPDIVTLDDDVVNSVIKTEMDSFIESLSEEETWYEGDDNDDDEWTEEEPWEEEETIIEITMTNNNNNAI
jgi:hypothetical protein